MRAPSGEKATASHRLHVSRSRFSTASELRSHRRTPSPPAVTRRHASDEMAKTVPDSLSVGKTFSPESTLQKSRWSRAVPASNRVVFSRNATCACGWNGVVHSLRSSPFGKDQSVGAQPLHIITPDYVTADACTQSAICRNRDAKDGCRVPEWKQGRLPR